MAVVEDILQTTLVLRNLGQWQQGMGAAAAVLGTFGNKSDEAAQALFNFGSQAGRTAVGLFRFMGENAKMAGEDTAAFQRALFGFRSHGNPFPIDDLQTFTGGLEQATGIADDRIAGIIGILGTFGAKADLAKNFTEPILDAAESLKPLGISAEQIANQVGKALETGKFSNLTRAGIVVKPEDVQRLGLTAAVLEAVKNQGAGAARAFRQTLPGSIQAANTAVESLRESLGALSAGPLTQAANAASALAYWFVHLPVPAQELTAGIILLAGVGLGGLSIAAKVAAVQTALLARAHAQAATAATAQAAAEAKLAGTLGAGAGAAGVGGAAGAAGKAAGGGIAARLGGGVGLLAGADVIGQTYQDAAKLLGLDWGKLPWWLRANFSPVETLTDSLFGGGGKPAAAAAGGGGGAAVDPKDKLLQEIADNTAATKDAIGSAVLERAIGTGRARRELARMLGG